ncbi:MAG: His/Gly/Thr/Pro-type tRNA ligase C-terminal domain-containing protein [Candidatus Parcubacteria bacterium]|nr:His/Gly/Thr/Pro-type tRNA ligase C-terminal domain-containing protein [Candidatus Parcubacteria bacterium]
MKQSLLFTKTKREVSEEEKSLNAQLLIRGGFIDKLAAGIYTFLPLGLRVLRKIENIIREEMNAIYGQEILMPALTPKEIWETTKRWENFDALFKLKGIDSKEYALGATHEEVITPLMQKFVFSYKDLPQYIYQIQTKFRNEARAKSGLLRGREFSMKDLYSFHADEKDLNNYYEKVIAAYFKIFERFGLKEITYLSLATGGAFSKFSHEFQTLAQSGEDTIYICPKCKIAYNKEIINIITKCETCQLTLKDFKEAKAIETANIFKLGTRFSSSFGFKFIDKAGEEKDVIMGCYGLGPSRIMGTVAEVNNDKKGIIWPQSIAPYQIHLVLLSPQKALAKKAEGLYNELIKAGFEVLYDDREESAGIKLNDSDLIGLPWRIIISDKTDKVQSVEIKRRNSEKSELIKTDKLINFLKKQL